MANILVEGRRTAEFLVNEEEAYASREVLTVASGEGKLAPGAVLGKVTATGKYRLVTAAATDGSQNAAAVLLAGVDATSADAPAVAIVREAVVNANLLTYGADIDTDAERKAVADALKATFVLVRS